MDGVVSHEGGRRRLPSWMLGVAHEQERQSEEKRSVKNDNPEAGIVSESHRSKLKVGNQPLETCSFVVEERETNRRKRKLSRQEVDSGNNIHEKRLEKKKSDGVVRAVQRSAQKKQKAESFMVENSKETEVLSLSDDDEELTMEDLMSIAKEYVETDKEMGPRQQFLDSKYQAEGQLPDISVRELESTLDVPWSNRSSAREETIVGQNSTENSASKGILFNPRTGDPTEDMLDLFLGHLLKKPFEEEKKIKLVIEDMRFTNEFKKQNQSDVLVEETFSLTKKKSSLKDKVALFLD